MSKPQAPCSKCKGEMSLTILDAFEGEEGNVKLTVQRMPAVVCAQGHRRFVYPEFAALLMDLMVSADTFASIPSAAKKGFLKKRFHCPDCDEELPAAPTGQQTLDVVAELKKSEPFTVRVEVPVLKCSDCGQECIQSAEEIGKLAFKATGHAYRSIDIHPN
jgi:hypothetical protein